MRTKSESKVMQKFWESAMLLEAMNQARSYMPKPLGGMARHQRSVMMAKRKKKNRKRNKMARASRKKN